jgi:hypothetical protein
MKHLTIRNIGPLDNVDIALSKINLVIGPQSTGKSCILKIASFCAWLEKSISLNQDVRNFLTREFIDTHLLAFHNLQGYINENSYFEYETDVMKFSFSFKENKNQFDWKDGRWDYKRSKIAYIVAERNVLSVIPNWLEIHVPSNSILYYFMTEWQNARNNNNELLPVLNTGVEYKYDKERKSDKIILNNGKELSLLNASSGLQSLVPLFVFIDYISKGIFKLDFKSVKDQDAKINLLYQLKENHPSGDYIYIEKYGISIGSDVINSIVENFTHYDHSDIYLEEPEENLFPETQRDLVNWLAETVNGERNHSLFIATHSPYIMSAFNNLIQAGDIIEESLEKKDEVENIIGGHRAIRYDDVTAFAISDGSVHSIKDDELRLISPSELDTVSDDIANVFNQLIAL